MRKTNLRPRALGIKNRLTAPLKLTKTPSKLMKKKSGRKQYYWKTNKEKDGYFNNNRNYKTWRIGKRHLKNRRGESIFNKLMNQVVMKKRGRRNLTKTQILHQYYRNLRRNKNKMNKKKIMKEGNVQQVTSITTHRQKQKQVSQIAN